MVWAGHDLSPECNLPFAPSLLRPPMLLWPAMLPAPLRKVRAVLAFVAIVFARATCRRPAHTHASIAYAMHACAWIPPPAIHKPPVQCAASKVWAHTDLALALCMPCRKPPICRRSSKSLSSLALSSKPPPGRRLGFGPVSDSLCHHHGRRTSQCLSLHTSDLLPSRCAVDGLSSTGSNAQTGLTFCGVLVPDYHAALAVAGKVARICQPPLCRGLPLGPRCRAGFQHIHRIPVGGHPELLMLCRALQYHPHRSALHSRHLSLCRAALQVPLCVLKR